MRCQFATIAEGVISCRRCGVVRRTVQSPENYFRLCDHPRAPLDEMRSGFTTPCVHRGTVLEKATCNACGMKAQPFEVFACELHGKCMVRRYRNDRPDLTVCFNCGDFLPLELP